jgi:hypothetical protein
MEVRLGRRMSLLFYCRRSHAIENVCIYGVQSVDAYSMYIYA